MRNIYSVTDDNGNLYLVNAGDELDARIAVFEKYPEYDESLIELEAELLFDDSTEYMTVRELL